MPLVTKRTALRIALFLLILLACSCSMPEHYLFTTDRDLKYSSEVNDLAFHEISFPAGDGPELYGWYLPGADDRQIILYFHGTATNLSHLTHFLKQFKHLDVGIFVFDYRGFGRSQGQPTEAGTYQDARGALNFLLRNGWTRDRIVYYGHSMGAAVALQLALEKPPAGVVLESPFTSIPDLIRHHHPWLFAALPWAFPPFYNNRSKISELKSPLMIFHGQRDAIVPPSMGQTLFSLAPEPKRLYLVTEAGHDDVYQAGDAAYWTAWQNFLSQVRR